LERVHHTFKYNRDFKTIPHYRNYPQMIPWVGKEYGLNRNKRILVVGESHYLPEKSVIHMKSRTWYSSNEEKLNEDEKEWTFTVGIISGQFYEHRSHWIFKNIEEAIRDTGFNPKMNEHMFRHIAYYNYFQRPAIEGLSLVPDDIDLRNSAEVFWSIIRIIKPGYICFVSKLA
jgi:ribosome-associated toxin RatA of RatAB toxin-antitoxin module